MRQQYQNILVPHSIVVMSKLQPYTELNLNYRISTSVIVTKYIFIVTNLTDFHKMVETGVDLHLIRIEELNVTGPHFVIQMCKNTVL